MNEREKQINTERYEQGIDKVENEFNLDFTNNPEHEQLLDEIQELAANIRDPKDRSVIHPSAIYLATQEVLIEKGMPTQPEPSAEEVKSEKKKSVAERLYQKNKERYEKELAWRKDPVR